MQKNLFITNVESLKIATNLGRGDKITDKIFITNDRPFIEDLLTPAFGQIAGSLEAYYLRNSEAVAYSIEETPSSLDHEAAIAFILERLAEVRVFLQMLWMVKDNSVNIDLGYLEYPYKDNKAFKTNVSRNSFANVFSTAAAEDLVTEFTRDELRMARHLLRDLKMTIDRRPQIAADERYTRFDRAFYFVQAARASSDLGVKIANYCICFETLFSTDSQEISHKLAERIACFLEKTSAPRLDLFHSIKKSYAIRSRVIHGGKGSSRLREQLKEGSISCDNILRRILVRILNDPSLQRYFREPIPDKDAEEYFVSLVLGSE